MVSTSLVVSFGISLLCTLVLPVVLLIVLGMKKKIVAAPLFAGFASFFISQILLRIPLLQVLSGQDWYVAFAANTVLSVIVIGGFSAGLFEETARLVGAKLLKQNRTYRDMISFGLGHGLCEVLILIGMGQINNLMACWMLMDPEAAMATGVTADMLQLLAQQLSATSPVLVYLGILERFSAVLFHLFATCLVFLAVKRGKPVLYLAAILAHTVFNAGVVLLLNALSGVMSRTAASAIAEAVLLAAALGCGAFVRRQKDRFDAPEIVAQSSTN